ncbi:MAG: TIGR03936 family radical SAM-associated protein [Eubacteriaceae bacterium]
MDFIPGWKCHGPEGAYPFGQPDETEKGEVRELITEVSDSIDRSNVEETRGDNQPTIKIRFTFKRTEELRFLSHLDQQRLFQRALRRADLPLAYSQGFNPHPILAFANAMSVGMTSDCEYVDIGIDIPEDHNPDFAAEMAHRLDAAMPEGIQITGAEILPAGAKSLTRMVEAADYEVCCPDLNRPDFNDFLSEIDNFNDRDEIMIEKRNKRNKLIQKNIRPAFDKLSAERKDSGICFELTVNAVDSSLIRPEAIITAFLDNIGYYNKGCEMIIHRKQLKLEGQK